MVILNFPSGSSRYQNVIKDFMKDIKSSLAIYERFNDYWTIFRDMSVFIVRFLLNYIALEGVIPQGYKFVTNYEKLIANDDAESFYRGRPLRAQILQMRPHHVCALLKIGKLDFSPMKAASLFERLEYGWMHRRISPHRSNVLTTPLRLSRYARVWSSMQAGLYSALFRRYKHNC